MPKRRKTPKVRVSITSPTADLPGAAAAAKKHGMKVTQVLDAIGVISGEIAESKYAALARTPGITVSRDEDVQLAPPDADVQ